MRASQRVFVGSWIVVSFVSTSSADEPLGKIIRPRSDLQKEVVSINPEEKSVQPASFEAPIASVPTSSLSGGPSLPATPAPQLSLPHYATPPIASKGVGLRSLGPVRIVRSESAPDGAADSAIARGASRLPVAATGWHRITPRAGQNDREATVRPSLERPRIEPDESYRRPSLPLNEGKGGATNEASRFQSSSSFSGQNGGFQYRLQNEMTSNFQPPVPNFDPRMAPPGGSVLPASPPPNNSVLPGAAPGAALNPNAGFPQNIPSPTNPNNLPQYQPRVVTGPPFVTPAPCQFDAYDMVHPANYAYPVCGGPSVFPAVPPNAASPYGYVPPTITPDMAPGMYSPNNSGWRPLFTLGQENYNVQIGRGIIGQPTAYVSGQPVRNFLRYIFP